MKRQYTITSLTRYTPDLIIKDTHRGLWYEDGRLTRVLEAGRYEYPQKSRFGRTPEIEVILVDMRERSIRVKRQKILTADKVKILVSLMARYRVFDPVEAVHAVEDYRARVAMDVQLAARRALASLPLDKILAIRHKLNDEILKDARESALTYGVEVTRADIQDVILRSSPVSAMQQAIQTERIAEAHILASTLAEMDRIQTQLQAEVRRRRSRDAEDRDARMHAGVPGSRESNVPVLLQLGELDTLRGLSHLSTARLFMGVGAGLKSNGDE